MVREARSFGDAPAAIRAAALPLARAGDLDPLMDRIGDARLVLLGEASHGTSEFYTWRTRITQRLILEKGFRFIAVEGDWPDCYRVNRFIKHYEHAGESAYAVMDDFERWPTWMWANREVVALVEWLYEHNAGLPPGERIGFYGLDVYSLFESMDAVLSYLSRVDPGALEHARAAYRCFEPFNRDEQRYARHLAIAPAGCAEDVVAVLSELRRLAPVYPDDGEARFSAEQNALVAVNAERYYRSMVRADEESWNVRDEHMADTLDRLLDFHGPGSRAVVWAHNTHIGDARYTDMAAAGMFNIGQLARERRHREGVVLVGFAAHRGRVIAGRWWGAPMEEMPVPPAREGSWEDALHRAGPGHKLLLLGDEADPVFDEPRGHRAIGVVYNPDRERYGNYVPTNLRRRYDALLSFEGTRALHPLHLRPEPSQMPLTFPAGV